MSTTSEEIATVRRRRVLPWATIIVSGATAIVIGLMSLETILSNTPNARTSVHATHSSTVAAPGPATTSITPSPVIEPNPKFFFGAGDGSAGYYSEQPAQMNGSSSR
jgi:hypothetical protein